MAPRPPDQASEANSHAQAMRRLRLRTERLVTKEVFHADTPVYGYTTPQQTTELAGHLNLRPGKLLLDIGTGRGYPGLQLARLSGCNAVLTDVPSVGLREAMRHARRERIPADFVRVDSEALPFGPGTFDAIVHTDLLC